MRSLLAATAAPALLLALLSCAALIGPPGVTYTDGGDAGMGADGDSAPVRIACAPAPATPCTSDVQKCGRKVLYTPPERGDVLGAASDETHVYWSFQPDADAGAPARILRWPKAAPPGTTAEVVATLSRVGSTVGVDSQRVYWLQAGFGDDGELVSIAKAQIPCNAPACTPETAGAGGTYGAFGLLGDGHALAVGTSGIVELTREGAAWTTKTIDAAPTAGAAVTTDRDVAYFHVDTDEHDVRIFDRDGTRSFATLPAAGRGVGLAVACDRVWALRSRDTAWAFDRDGGAVVGQWSLPRNAASPVADGTFVYFADVFGGLFRLDVSSGAVDSLIGGAMGAVTVDATPIYAGARETGELSAITK